MNISRIEVWSDLSEVVKTRLLKRPQRLEKVNLSSLVGSLIADVKRRGDAALKDLTQKYDGVTLTNLQVSPESSARALKNLDPDLQNAIMVATTNICKFHEVQLPTDLVIETQKGIRCEKRSLPIDRVGIYIPAGTAPLFSTLMMLAIPAKIAGCQEIVLFSPPLFETGEIDQTILAVAEILGINKIFQVGGAQAIAALAYGTETVPKVDKIFGPGNAFVTEAKMQVSIDPDGATIDVPAGPSELMIIADELASASFIAADLLSQAEHDENSQVMLVSPSLNLIEAVQREVQIQLLALPRRKIAEQALESCRYILTKDLVQCLEISNAYGPEHLIIQTEFPREIADKVRNAGSVFIGAWAPESVGDYASGTNHVLPTYGFTKSMSGVGVESFMKNIFYQELTAEGFKELGPSVELLAGYEGLAAHKMAVTLRLNQLELQ